jgi:DnaJ domain
MFERTRVDNAPEASAVPVEVVLADGTLTKGKLLVSAGKTLSDALNGTTAFIEFEPYGGERAFLSKAQLASVQLVGVPKAANLSARTRDGDSFNPHAILGVAANAGWEEIRQAYHKLAKSYHPDRYASAELPVEVQDYLAAMARRVNAAYAALEVPRQAAKIPTAAARAAAVYTRASA